MPPVLTALMFAALAIPVVSARPPDGRAPDPRIRAPYDDVAGARRGSLAVGLGGSWILGGNADGYSGGVAERIGGALAIGEVSAFVLDVEHTRHTLADAGAYFPGIAVPASSVAGFRDYVVMDAGFRLGFDFSDQTRVGRGARVSAYPFLRSGAALVLTTTRLDVPSLSGRRAISSVEASPALSLGGGAEVRIRRWISLLPHVKAQVLLKEDPSETSGGSRWGLEWRVQPAIDVSFNL